LTKKVKYNPAYIGAVELVRKELKKRKLFEVQVDLELMGAEISNGHLGRIVRGKISKPTYKTLSIIYEYLFPNLGKCPNRILRSGDANSKQDL